MRTSRRGLLPQLMLTLACAAPTTWIDLDPSFELARYRSFAFAAAEERPAALDPVASELVRARVERAISTELASRGLRHAPPEQADLWVHFEVTGLEREGVRPPLDPWREAWWEGAHVPPPRPWEPLGDVPAPRVRTALLVIDLFDRAAERLVWRGWSEDESEGAPDEESVQRTVAAILGRLSR